MVPFAARIVVYAGEPVALNAQFYVAEVLVVPNAYFQMNGSPSLASRYHGNPRCFPASIPEATPGRERLSTASNFKLRHYPLFSAGFRKLRHYRPAAMGQQRALQIEGRLPRPSRPDSPLSYSAERRKVVFKSNGACQSIA
jgi:hypothetical protein